MTREEMQAFQDEHKGDFVAVPLDSKFGFGRYIRSASFAFYDLLSSAMPPLEEIEKAPVLFIMPVEFHAMISGHWRMIGNRPLNESLSAPIKYFRHPFGTDFLDIYVGGKFQPYAGEDLTTMECLAVCGPRHVEDRLRCHFAGQRDEATERFKIPHERAEKFRREYFEQQRAAGKKRKED